MSGKKIAALVVLAVVLVSAVAVAVLPSRTPTATVQPGDAVGLIRLSGPIQESTSGSVLGAVGITPRLVRTRLAAAQGDPRIRAVVIRLDSPGGTVAASQEISQLVAAFPKPVVVSMADITTSGGYYVAAQADRIVAQPGTLTGSIGVIWTTMDIEGLLEKLGIEQEVITAGEHKDMFQRLPLAPEERRIVEEMVDQLHAQFIEAVARGRNLSEAEARSVATGRVFTGAQALERGLVDRLGGLDEAVAEAEALAGIEDSSLIELTPSFFEQLFYGPGFGELRLVLERLAHGEELTLLRRLLDHHQVPRYEVSR